MEHSLRRIEGVEFWVLLVVTNKNHGQPFVQYAERRYLALLIGASYHPGRNEFPQREKIVRKCSPKLVWWGGAILNV